MSKTQDRNMTQILQDGEWIEATRKEEAENFGVYWDLPDYARELFPAWYAKQPKLWKPVNQVEPLTGVGSAYNAWLRRP